MKLINFYKNYFLRLIFSALLFSLPFCQMEEAIEESPAEEVKQSEESSRHQGNSVQALKAPEQGTFVSALEEPKTEVNKKGIQCLITNFDPSAYGACTMDLGFVYTGHECLEVRGCSCQNDCDKFFNTRQTCLRTCTEE